MKLKGSKWYRREYLTYHASDFGIQCQTKTYLDWLCRHRNWFTDQADCHACEGTGQIPAVYERVRGRIRYIAGRPVPIIYRDCKTCGGTGKVQIKPVPDHNRAEAHVRAHDERLYEIAAEALTVIRENLVALGFNAARPFPDSDYEDLSRYVRGDVSVHVAMKRWHARWRAGRCKDTAPTHEIVIRKGQAPGRAELDWQCLAFATEWFFFEQMGVTKCQLFL